MRCAAETLAGRHAEQKAAFGDLGERAENDEHRNRHGKGRKKRPAILRIADDRAGHDRRARGIE
jgi:hypothetical protein